MWGGYSIACFFTLEKSFCGAAESMNSWLRLKTKCEMDWAVTYVAAPIER
jgi:hypothetical protein